MYKFVCRICDQEHDGIPSFGVDRPDQYWDVPEEQRESDVFLTSDTCVIADQFFFVRGCLEIPVIDTDDVMDWGVWVSLKKENFFLFQDNLENMTRSGIGPFFGWLSTKLPYYENTLLLKVSVHLRDNKKRPYIELEKTNHTLSVDQRKCISIDKVHEIYNYIVHHEKRVSLL